MRISFVKSNPCEAPSSIRRHEFDVLLEEEFTISFSPKIDLSFCDQYSVAEDQSCKILKSIKPGLEEESPNVCEFLSRGSQIEKCKASFAITNITNGFRNLLLLNADPKNVVASESVVGDYYANVKYPCIE
ncbi:hypothetical protein HOLleu_45211 [Holothuria leucospilota]|uniref:Uncharacterized protein n=1 Tax=Holothuria leucospilota TaxID=206669 RepID=A0A9Q0YA35_HOLLE|nr:hypothetical protein HOLleu_45211 [Holothuria leucospilota]